jgi:hypothetical protein
VVKAPIPPDPVVEVCKIVSFALWLIFIPFYCVFQCENRKKRRKRNKPRKRGPNRLRKRGCRAGVQHRQTGLGTIPHSSWYRGFLIGVASQWFLGCWFDPVWWGNGWATTQLSSDRSPRYRWLSKGSVTGGDSCGGLGRSRVPSLFWWNGNFPVVRSWCIQKFCELNPGAPCFDFDFI